MSSGGGKAASDGCLYMERVCALVGHAAAITVLSIVCFTAGGHGCGRFGGQGLPRDQSRLLELILQSVKLHHCAEDQIRLDKAEVIQADQV